MWRHTTLMTFNQFALVAHRQCPETTHAECGTVRHDIGHGRAKERRESKGDPGASGACTTIAFSHRDDATSIARAALRVHCGATPGANDVTRDALRSTVTLLRGARS